VKIYVTVVEVLKKNERGVQNRMKLSLPQNKKIKMVLDSPPVENLIT
jgi:hypothetical protein